VKVLDTRSAKRNVFGMHRYNQISSHGI